MIDIGEPQGPTEAVEECEARLQALLSSLGDLVFELDEDGTYLGIWTTNDSLLAKPRDELLGRTHAEVISEDLGLRLKQVTTTVLETGRPETWEYSLEVPAGLRWFQGHVAPIAAHPGRAKRICLLVRDITAQKLAEQQLSRLLAREQLLDRLSEAIPVGLFEIDVAGRLAFTNDRAQAAIGDEGASTVTELMASVAEADRPVLEAALAAAFNGEAVDGAQIRLRRGGPDVLLLSGAERICDLSLRALTDAAGTVTGVVGCLSDMTDRVQLRRELELRVSLDKLTSCFNREASLELLERATAAPQSTDEGNALIFIDLDDFKSVNDRYGHVAGDRLLAEVADRLRDAARKGDAVGRVGADEFIVICPHVQSSAQAIKVAERVAAATSATVDIGGTAIELRTSVGVAWTAAPIEADAFLAQANSAMYQSKHTSRKGVTLFSTNGCGLASSGPAMVQTL